jgi:hypothetical protein
MPVKRRSLKTLPGEQTGGEFDDINRDRLVSYDDTFAYAARVKFKAVIRKKMSRISLVLD